MAPPARARACALLWSSVGGVALSSLALGGCGGAATAASSEVPRYAHAESSEPAGDPWGGAPNKRVASLERAETRLAKSLLPDDATAANPDSATAEEGEPLAKKGRHPTGTPNPIAAPRSQGERCLAELRAQNVRFKSLDARPGIETPVLVSGPVGKVTYFAHGIELILDCRMALALVRISPIFGKHGVTKVRFSGAYVYRLTRHGKLSLHANGLALDVHALSVGNEVHDVQREFARGAGCEGKLPLVNRVACELRATELFREVITPDYDADHKDHLHIAIPRLASTPSTISVERAPAPAPRDRARKKRRVSQEPPAPGSLPEAIPAVPTPENARSSN